MRHVKRRVLSSLSNNLQGTHRSRRRCARLFVPVRGHHLGATDGAPAVLAEPRVDALGVEAVLATGQHPAPVARAEHVQAHRAVAAAAVLLDIVARQLVDLLCGQPGAGTAFLQVPPDADGGARAVERPDDHDDVHDAHQGEADDEEDDGVG
jgi:hypothetical protein